MKKWLVLSTLLVLSAAGLVELLLNHEAGPMPLSIPVSADESDIISGICPRGTYLKHIGSAVGAATDVTSITGSGRKVLASRVSCGGTACVATLYDSAADPTANRTTVANTDINEEPGAPANQSAWTTYSPPLDFRNGIAYHSDSNVNAILTFECRP